MKKYFLVAKNTWAEMLTYRLNFVMWRVRGVVFLLSMYFLWLAVIPKGTLVLGYNQELMLTYIFGALLVNAIVFSSRSYAIGDDINQGNLSNYLIRPLHYLFYWVAKDMGDKFMNIMFSIVELCLLFYILHPPFFLQTNGLYLIPFAMSIIFAMILNFFFNMLLGFIGFWSPEVWAPRFIYFMISSFLVGIYFPLDILPANVVNMFQYLPFTYMLYFPLKIYLGQLSLVVVYQGLFVSILWTFLLYIITQFIWQKGLKIYTAQGR